jgi:hypothetical protein
MYFIADAASEFLPFRVTKSSTHNIISHLPTQPKMKSNLVSLPVKFSAIVQELAQVPSLSGFPFPLLHPHQTTISPFRPKQEHRFPRQYEYGHNIITR